MAQLPCPACGAGVAFRGGQSVYAVCAFCGSMVVRHDVDLSSIGRMAALPPDMSPFQIGTTCLFLGVEYTLAGRVKVGYPDGVWNEWFALGGDGAGAWLAEAQGTYAFSFERPLPAGGANDDVLDLLRRQAAGEPDKTVSALGREIADGPLTLRVVDIRTVTCIGSEGELPFAAPSGREVLSVDLIGRDGEFGCIEFSAAGSRYYQGLYVEWPDLKAANLRALEGWA
ncbi:DUF4178 domain-containing protein [Zavarzinia compransoris]|uniref:DUF4178 domain-containing protein n=1 Tax=Zavarzinia compransoris TaxID=1264899 RepID=A0A317EAD2_9PROT|nr:DUF4178 domain-containing protein [Zavarzinia compransoris]PWR23522.1 DUF4178 domain-containing protein [Zavarzinia compransoris]TDP47733.1 uncharacterized protein DUF4178 [Zavarzinia compransoris]